VLLKINFSNGRKDSKIGAKYDCGVSDELRDTRPRRLVLLHSGTK
jgi:hypothetical protein